jgi:hypothetical protein
MAVAVTSPSLVAGDARSLHPSIERQLSWSHAGTSKHQGEGAPGSPAITGWSVTEEMTEEPVPTPTPAGEQCRTLRMSASLPLAGAFPAAGRLPL